MLRIWGVEATQSTQFFGSAFLLCTGPDGTRIPCPDNSLPLVAGKPTVLRLYVSGAMAGDNLGAVATVPDSTPFGPTWKVVGTGAMVATTRPASRLDPSTTIQIVLRAQPVGTYRFDVVVLNYGPNWGGVPATATRSITLTFNERRRIRIRLVRIRYGGRGMNVVEPAQRDFWNATNFAQRALPIPSPGFDLVRDSVALYDGDFTRIDPSAHDPTWSGYADNRGTTGNLLNILDSLVTAESLPADVIYVAIYPDNVNQAAFAGWAVGRWIISDRNGQTFAHEILHHFGVPQHAPCGQPPNVDPGYPDYPAFSSLPASSIGEVGFDCEFLSVRDPMTTFDLMSYCAPKWISPYNYQRAFNALTPLPAPPPRPPSGFQRGDYVDISFQHFPPDHWIVIDLPGFPRPRPPRRPIPTSDLEVQLVDARGAEIFRGPAPIDPSEFGGDGEPTLVQTIVPWRKEAASIALCRGREVLVRRRILPPPKLEATFPSAAEIEVGTGTVAFRTSVPGQVAVAVRATLDGGATWMATVLREPEGNVELAPLLVDAGDDCYLQVIATSGYHSTERTSERFRVRPREHAMLAWSSAERGRASRSLPVQLFAIADGGVTGVNDVWWYSDLDGELGQGNGLSVMLQPGRHRIEARSERPFLRPTRMDLVVE